MKTRKFPYSTIIKELEDAIWEYEAMSDIPYEYSLDDLRASLKLFVSTFLWFIHLQQVKDDIPQSDREDQVLFIGEKIAKMVKVYTGINTKDLYKR